MDSILETTEAKQNACEDEVSNDKSPDCVDQMAEKSKSEDVQVSENEVFKMPMLIGPRLQSKNISPKGVSFPTKKQECLKTENVVENPTEKFSLCYEEPSWGGLPTDKYSVEILKCGSIVSTVDLCKKSYYSLGRLTNNDVVLEHPTSSRFHAVLQFRKDDDENMDEGSKEKRPRGFYLYDLESTHGTFLNKNRLKPKIYYHVRVGHMFKFGNSTRVYILQGPSEDQEEESEFTVTELKEMRRKAEENFKQMQLAEQERLQKQEEDKEEAERQRGIDWGMAEDAVEDGVTENPFALDSATVNEDMYISDPKKTLRGWFEREGYELEYLVEEKGPAKFACRIQLPLDLRSGEKVFAEATVKGKKKEAVAACALEACKMLDRHGVLRQANHESRKHKSRDWEKDDFYDSEEDTFLDRTGTIEKKRMQRLEKAGKGSLSTVDTYETLVEKHERHVKAMERLQQEIDILTQEREGYGNDNAEADPLEAFMMSLQGENKARNKQTRSRLKMRLIQMQQEEARLKRLVRLAKPAELPTLSLNTSDGITKSMATSGALRAQSKLKQYGLMKVVKRKESAVKIHEDYETSAKEDEVNKLEDTNKDSDTVMTAVSETETVIPVSEEPENISNSQDDPVSTSESSETNATDAADVATSAVPQKRRKSENKVLRRQKHSQQRKFDYDESDPNYALWLPPTDQTGDGTTKLNAKYGY